MSWQILIVEDDPSFPSELQDMLQMLIPDCGVTVAVGADYGLDELRETPFDLVLVDVDSPGLDAGNFVRQGRLESGRGVPYVAVTVFAAPEGGGAAEGYADRLAKPIDLDELAGVLTRQLDATAVGVGV
jgi:CheY-like chemotaxis protein